MMRISRVSYRVEAIKEGRLKVMAKLVLVSHLFMWGGVSFDIGTTLRAPARLENNPLVGNHRAQQIVVGIGTSFVADVVITKRLEPRHPTVAKVFRFAIGGAHLAAGVHNTYNGQ